MTQNEQKPSFDGLGIAPKLLASIAKHFTIPTPIQHQVIPVALEGKDVVGIAQTGTGKTLAFGVPAIQILGQTAGQALILLPTRELALQVEEMLLKIGRELGLRTAVLIGGASMYMQEKAISRNPHVIVATPGRLMDHLEQKNLTLNNVKIVVLDEADRMLDIGFMPQIRKILAQAPKERQTMLFSATMPPEIAHIASSYMKMPLRIEVAPAGTAADNVEQEVYIISKQMKIQLLDKILTDNPGTILVFSRTKHGAKKITSDVRSMGHTAVEIHSNRSLSQRREALDGFKSGKYRILIATDIAARGIDVKNITLVVNFDLPDKLEDYVHRIGRTGRAGSSGKAISFASPDQLRDVKQIERLIKKTIPILSLPTLPPRRMTVAAYEPEDREDRFERRGGGGGRGGFAPRRSSGGFAPRSGAGARPAGGRPSGGHGFGSRGPSRGGRPSFDRNSLARARFGKKA